MRLLLSRGSFSRRSYTVAAVAATASTGSAATRSIRELFTPENHGADLTWAGPLHECLCGCDLFHIMARFESGQVAQYFTDAVCTACGSWLVAPTEIDERTA